jgi:hypothetical protein
LPSITSSILERNKKIGPFSNHPPHPVKIDRIDRMGRIGAG